MSKEKIELIIEGGKATATPDIAQKLGPLGIMNNVLSEVNQKTSEFKNMKVPVKIFVDAKDKSFEIEVGIPSISELVKKELSLEKGSAKPSEIKVGNLAIEQVIKLAKMKKDGMYVKDLKAAIKSVIGTSNSLGVLVEGKEANAIINEINSGLYDDYISNETSQVTPEKINAMKEQLIVVQKQLEAELAKMRALEEVTEKPKEKVEKAEEEKAEGEKEAQKEAKKPETKETKKEGSNK